MGNATTHLGHIKLAVDDLDRCTDFYRDVCGLTETGRAEAVMNGRHATEVMFAPTEDGGPILILVNFQDFPAPQSPHAFLGFTTVDLEAFCARLVAAGGRLTQEITEVPHFGVKAALGTDIEGNSLEVVQVLQREQARRRRAVRIDSPPPSRFR